MQQNGTPATHASVHELAVALSLDEAAYRRAMELAELQPDRRDWLRYLDRFLTAVGTLLIVAGIAAFFAWNWADLHHTAKFALVQSGIVACIALAWQLGIDSTGGRAGLFAAAFMVGILFAVFGQVYQTGADPYGLFMTWAILILPWALVARQAALWMLFVVLLNLTLIMYWTQVLHPPDGWWQLAQLLGPLVWLGSTVVDSGLASWLFALNAAALVLWEIAAASLPWLRGRTAPRMIALMALHTVLAPTLIIIFAASAGASANLNAVSPVLFTAALAASLFYYQYRRRDLFMLTAALFGTILAVMALAVRLMFDTFQSLLLLTVVLVGLVAGAAYWLKGVSQRWEATA